MTDQHVDEIVEEIRRRRQAHAESLGNDLQRIVAELQKLEREAGVQTVERPARLPTPMQERSSA